MFELEQCHINLPSTKINFHDIILDFKPKVKTGIEDLLRSQVAETLPFKIRHTRGSASSARARASTRGSISSQQPNKKVKGKAITSKSVQWPCFPPFKLELLSPVKKSRVNSVNELMKEKLISRKSTRVHEEVVQSRDQVFEVCLCMTRSKAVCIIKSR